MKHILQRPTLSPLLFQQTCREHIRFSSNILHFYCKFQSCEKKTHLKNAPCALVGMNKVSTLSVPDVDASGNYQMCRKKQWYFEELENFKLKCGRNKFSNNDLTWKTILLNMKNKQKYHSLLVKTATSQELSTWRKSHTVDWLLVSSEA